MRCADKVLEVLDIINGKDFHLDLFQLDHLEAKKERYRMQLGILGRALPKVGEFRMEMLFPILMTCQALKLKIKNYCSIFKFWSS